MPLCDLEGNFVPRQCFKHDGYGKQCWCVDSSGQEIKGSRLSNGSMPECGKCRFSCSFNSNSALLQKYLPRDDCFHTENMIIVSTYCIFFAKRALSDEIKTSVFAFQGTDR